MWRTELKISHFPKHFHILKWDLKKFEILISLELPICNIRCCVVTDLHQHALLHTGHHSIGNILFNHSGIFSWFFLLQSVFLFSFCVCILQRFFIASSLQLKRLDHIARSPIYSHFQESVQGSSVILASRQGDRFVLDNERRVDTNQKPFFLFLLSHRSVV